MNEWELIEGVEPPKYEGNQIYGTMRKESNGPCIIYSNESNQDDVVAYNSTARSFKTNSNSDVDVVIDDVDTEGKFIRLVNKGEEEFSIGTWTIKSTAGDREIMFQFHTRQNIKPGKSITIWSADSGESHTPPTNIVMENQSWPTGDAVRAELLNNKKFIVAWRKNWLNSIDPDQRCSIM